MSNITWLARVVDVISDLLTQDEFGEMRSGRLILNGPLGVLRMGRTEQRQGPSSRGFYRTQHTARLFFDTALQQTTTFQIYISVGSEMNPNWTPGNSDLFYMPIRLMDEVIDGRTAMHRVLKGLLLAPTGKRHGEYSRVGVFESSNAWDGHCVQALRCNRTDIYSSQYFVSKGGTRYTIDVV